MRPFTVDLPGHTLRFSLPNEVAREMTPTQVETKFDPRDPNYLKNGFLVLASELHDFNGPFWKGAYGSLKFTFKVVKRDTAYEQKIGTHAELEHYVHWWILESKNAEDFRFAQRRINHTLWLARLQDTFGQVPTPAEPNAVDVEIFSHPIDDDMFLEAGFRITEWVPGSSKKWKRKAEEFRDAIKSTISLEAKNR